LYAAGQGITNTSVKGRRGVMADIDPPGTTKPPVSTPGATGRLFEPPTNQALWPTFMRRTIAAEPFPRPEKRPKRVVRATT
jgi:hypothetical protein